MLFTSWTIFPHWLQCSEYICPWEICQMFTRRYWIVQTRIKLSFDHCPWEKIIDSRICRHFVVMERSVYLSFPPNFSHFSIHRVTEIGAMNIFVYWKNKVTGDPEVVTCPLNGLVLPGITRKSVLSLLRDMDDEDFEVYEREYTI